MSDANAATLADYELHFLRRRLWWKLFGLYIRRAVETV